MNWSLNNIPNITNIGEKALAYQAKLASVYNYKKLETLSEKVHQKYIDELPIGFTSKEHKIHSVSKPGFELKLNYNFPIYSRKGTLIAKKMNRIVIGDYGAFIEINAEDMCSSNIKVKPGQEYRIHDEKYKDKVKYQWYTTKDSSDCKLYYQQKPVSYADYKPNCWYISPFEVLDKDELLNLNLITEKEIKKNEDIKGK